MRCRRHPGAPEGFSADGRAPAGGIGARPQAPTASVRHPMPQSYVLKVVDSHYRPGLAQMIDDYLVANPTRNRDLDMLPLFAELDPERVRRQFQSPLVKARPTFHYRLPDTRLSDPSWGLITEWNRWVQVEWLAADRERLDDACRHYCAFAKERRLSDWGDTVRQWLRPIERS